MDEMIKAGGLEFYPENRMGGQDGGPTLRVCAMVDGARVELLRIDMFHNLPHYHYAPMGVNLRYDLDPLTIDDGIGWATTFLSNKLPAMVAKAGYEQLLTPGDADEAIAAIPEIERRWRAVCLAQPLART